MNVSLLPVVLACDGLWDVVSSEVAHTTATLPTTPHHTGVCKNSGFPTKSAENMFVLGLPCFFMLVFLAFPQGFLVII